MRTVRRWWPAAFGGLAAILVLFTDIVVGRAGRGVLLGVLMLALGWILSPGLFPRSADLTRAEAGARAGRAPVVFWKPGCSYCIRMRLSLLGRTGRRVSWVDSSVDPAAERLVRAANNGDHTTPTVVFCDEVRTNPHPSWVRSLVR